MLISMSKNKDHYTNSLVKVSKLYFMSDRANSKVGFENITLNRGKSEAYIASHSYPPKKNPARL